MFNANLRVYVLHILSSRILANFYSNLFFSGNPREDSETAIAAPSPAKVSHPTSSSSSIGAIAEAQHQQPNNSETTNMLLVQAHHHQVSRFYHKGKFFLKVKLDQNIWQPYLALLRWDIDILIL